MRGISNPEASDFISSIADSSAVLPSVLMDTCAERVEHTINAINKKTGFLFFIALLLLVVCFFKKKAVSHHSFLFFMAVY